MDFSRSITRSISRTLLLALLLLLTFTVKGDAANICDPVTGTNCQTVQSGGSAEVVTGKSTRATYIASLSSVSYTAVESLINLEAEAGRGFRITEVCVSGGSATAAAWTTWQLIRTTSASSAGTTIAAESTTTHSVTKMDPADANWSGAARTGGTEGTSGAVIDQGTIFVNITATPPAAPGADQVCHTYCKSGDKCPTVIAGVANGVKLMFTATAGGALQSAFIKFVGD